MNDHHSSGDGPEKTTSIVDADEHMSRLGNLFSEFGGDDAIQGTEEQRGLADKVNSLLSRARKYSYAPCSGTL